MRRVLSVVGARPQFIKAAPVTQALREAGIEEVLVHTGQHYDDNMSHQFFRELDIPQPAYKLDVGSGPHGAQTGRMLLGLEPIMQREMPDVVMVYGDTNSTLAGALTAVKLGLPVAHVEAGLRSYNRTMPEEINRVATDRISTILFAPTEAAAAILLREGFDETAIHMVGDVMFDATLMVQARAQQTSRIVAALGLDGRRYVLSTIHRQENTDDPRRLSAIVAALDSLAQTIRVVLPLHPRTRRAMAAAGLQPGNLDIIEPVGYLDMMRLASSAALIATDSGGLQKEAFFHGVPCVTLRQETEWTELVECGWNRLLPPESVSSLREGLDKALAAAIPAERPRFYGDGHAARLIAAQLAT